MTLPRSRDEELTGAWILSGHAAFKSDVGRYCFQTTYVNECYREYVERAVDFKLVWLLREPSSVVRSMVYNWKRDALNELFVAVGRSFISAGEQARVKTFGAYGVDPIRRACYAYVGKTLQVIEIAERLGPEKLWVGDYDMLLERPDDFMSNLGRFLNLSLVTDSLLVISKEKSNSEWVLDSEAFDLAGRICGPAYREAKRLISTIDESQDK